jgi:hypothetical protein
MATSKPDNKKLDEIIAMLRDIVRVFGERFDRSDRKIDAVEKNLTDKIDAVNVKVQGAQKILDAEALLRADLKLPRRVHDLEEHLYGPGKSKHPKHLPL